MRTWSLSRCASSALAESPPPPPEPPPARESKPAGRALSKLRAPTGFDAFSFSVCAPPALEPAAADTLAASLPLSAPPGLASSSSSLVRPLLRAGEETRPAPLLPAPCCASSAARASKPLPRLVTPPRGLLIPALSRSAAPEWATVSPCGAASAEPSCAGGSTTSGGAHAVAMSSRRCSPSECASRHVTHCAFHL